MRLDTCLHTLAILLIAAPLRAHDFWIEPATFRPAKDARVVIGLRVGERHVGDEVPRKEARIVRFTSTSASGTSAIVGVEDKAPAGYLRATAAGLVSIAYESKPTAIELEAKKFEGYLREEGLEHVSEARRARGQTDAPGREQYSRSAKALLVVGDGPHSGFDQALGQALELVPVNDPTTLRPGDTLELRLLHAGKPLAGALVGCSAKVTAEIETRIRTDAEGRVKFVLGAPGTALVRVVHMAPAPEGSGADWSSLWASLTFDVLPAAAAGATAKPG